MTFKNIKNKDQGFTIVELLIVIIVIGILATLVLIAYNNVQGQARDTKRQANVNSLRQAAETYKTQSPTGGYPDMTSGTTFQNSLNALSPKTVSIDQSITAGLNASGGPSAGNPEYITSAWCGGTTSSDATGIKFTYWQENKKTVNGSQTNTLTTSTGVGC